MKKKIIIIVSTVVVILISLYAFYSYKLGNRNDVEKLISEKKLINIMVAGSNIFNERKHRFFSVISINPENNNIGITFIPQTYKVATGDSTDEFTLLKEMDFDDFDIIRKSLHSDIKLNIPFYIELYAPDVRRIVDLIEGVNLFILDQKNSVSNLKFGMNYFDGIRIMKYINDVEENSIYRKFDRIRDIILTLYYNIEARKNLVNLSFISETVKSISTNMLPRELLNLGEIVSKKGKILTSVLPGNFKDGIFTIDDISYKSFEQDFITPLVVNSKSDVYANVKILNGTSVSGLAGKMRRALKRDGVNVVVIGTSPFQPMKKSIIISRNGNSHAVQQVSEFTGITNIHYILDSRKLHDVLIVIGEDLIK